jgi:hypothetical protein
MGFSNDDSFHFCFIPTYWKIFKYTLLKKNGRNIDNDQGRLTLSEVSILWYFFQRWPVCLCFIHCHKHLLAVEMGEEFKLNLRDFCQFLLVCHVQKDDLGGRFC